MAEVIDDELLSKPENKTLYEEYSQDRYDAENSFFSLKLAYPQGDDLTLNRAMGRVYQNIWNGNGSHGRAISVDQLNFVSRITP